METRKELKGYEAFTVEFLKEEIHLLTKRLNDLYVQKTEIEAVIAEIRAEIADRKGNE